MRFPTYLTPVLAVIVCGTAFVASDSADATLNDGDVCGFSSTARFTESAPRDRFSLQNTSSGDWSIISMTLDLSSSAGNLIFDVTAEGAGVEVFQPFRAEPGEAILSTQPVVDDGDQSIALIFSAFNPGDAYQFSIDVDDQLTQSELGQIRVSGGEISDAAVELVIVNQLEQKATVTGVFDQSNQMSLDSDDC